MSFNATTRLSHPSTAEITLLPESMMLIRDVENVYKTGKYGLIVLELFRQPTSIRDAIERAKPLLASPQALVELISTIHGLSEAGILRNPDAAPDEKQTQPLLGHGYESAIAHVVMLDDHRRVNAYRDAIARTVKPGDVVVDVGTGTGLLAIMAAQAGAARVYAIERTAISEVARANFIANGVADRVTLIHGVSTEVDLPERADVMVSELIGTKPLDEQATQFTSDAVARFLKPDARIIPQGIRIYGQLTRLPKELVRMHTFTPDRLSAWHDAYGIDFSAMANFVPARGVCIYRHPERVKTWKAISGRLLLETIDFQRERRLSLNLTAEWTAIADDVIDGAWVDFDLLMCEGVTYSHTPAVAVATDHWHIPVWMLPKPLDVRAGDRLRLLYRDGTALNATFRVERL